MATRRSGRVSEPIRVGKRELPYNTLRPVTNTINAKMMKRKFKHSPLLPGPYFRLLNLLPGSFDNPIQCELLSYELAAAPSYEPISYAWGNSAMSQEITCNSRSLFITKTLFQALRGFRQPDQPRLLWTDGICINQNNEQEKSHQVAFMSTIYKHGYRTLIWLGEDDEHQDCAMNDTGCVEHSLTMIKQLNRCIESRIMAMDRTGDPHIWASLHRIPSTLPELVLWQDQDGRRCLAHLLKRPWFSRCWVVNEVGISARAAAFIGKSSIKWSEIAVCAQICASNSNAYLDMPTDRICDAFSGLWATMALQKSWINAKDMCLLVELVSFYREKDELSYLRVLNTSRRFSATVPHDHVYAFKGHPLVESFIDTDYSWTLSEVHRRLAEQLMLKSQRLDMLCYVDNREEDLDPSKSVLSWVPQWHRDISARGETLAQWTGVTVESDEIVMDVSDNQLHVAALLVDQVGNHSEQMKYEDFHATFDGTTPVVQLLYAMHQHALQQSAKEVKMSKNLWDIFIWTLNLGGYPHPSCIKQDFLLWCQDNCGYLYQLSNSDPYFEAKENLPPPSKDDYLNRMTKCCCGRKFFTTIAGGCGLGPGLLEDGDILGIIFGCRMPLILRPAGTAGTCKYRVVGPCYFHELMVDDMYNSAAVKWRNGSLKKTIIYLV